MSDGIVRWLQDRSRPVLAGFVVLTIMFAAANVVLDSDTAASQEPDAEVFRTRDDVNSRLPPLVHTSFMIVEASDGGDVLRAGPLAELVANSAALRDADRKGLLAPEAIEAQPLLAQRFDPSAGRETIGFINLAEVVAEGVMQTFGVELADANDDMVKVVLSHTLDEESTAPLSQQLSVQATHSQAEVLGQQITLVTSPALVFEVQAWNEPLGGGEFEIGPSSDPVVRQKEEFNLAVEQQLRGDEAQISVWGIALASNVSADEQGATAAPFIVLAVVSAVLIAGISLQSYWATALTGIGLAVLMTWLGGISNLLGVKGGLIIDLIVPISMVALGVDFAIHSMAHYQRERSQRERSQQERSDTSPRVAFRVGLGGVLGALAIAAATDSAAFLSNSTSSIESIAHFGVAAAIATVSAFIVLGIVAPLALSVIEEGLRGESRPIGRFGFSTKLASVRVAVVAGAASIVTLAVSPLAGAGLTMVMVFVGLVLPYRYASRHPGDAQPGIASSGRRLNQRSALAVGRLVAWLAAKPVPVLLATLVVTAGALVGASGLEGSFKVEDFFAPDTDFVLSVNKIPEHLGARGGEVNKILIEGDLTQPESWVQIEAFVNDLGQSGVLATDVAGGLRLSEPNALSILGRDGIPDTAAQIQTLWEDALTNGVRAADGTELVSAAQVRTIIDLAADGTDAMLLSVQVPDSGDFATMHHAGQVLEQLTGTLEQAPTIDRASATGSGLGRIEVIDASTDALKTSLPLASVAVFLVLLLGLRSVKYAAVTTAPMLLVAAWLYGTMALLGLDLNLVTATIGAISIGVGADYAIHMTERYRHERPLQPNHVEAARAAAESTGMALVASAVSTAVGFFVLALAPMPLFATFGLLTALMVTYALIASLVVLPPMLAMLSRNETGH